MRRPRKTLHIDERRSLESGIDAQILRNEEFSYSCRFPIRAFAIAWAELERQVLEQQHDAD